MPSTKSSAGTDPARALGLAALALLAVRAALLPLVPLTDPTESRYAMTAVLMADSGDWTSPRVFVDGAPVVYWGKPPLHFWLTAACVRLLGVHVWVVRLPAFLLGLLTIWLTWRLGRAWWGPRAGRIAAAVLATSALFLGHAGASTLDMTLTAAVTAALADGWLALRRRNRAAGLRAALWLALGFLAKGPVALVLVGLPVLVWTALRRDPRPLRRLPWLAGALLFVLLAAPWFLLAERATPGFLSYFFLSENLGRFLHASYGDRYGVGHRHAFGLIWPVLVLSFLPWSAGLIASLWSECRAGRLARRLRADSPLAYALGWALAAPLLFTFAPSWLPAYLVPAMPGLALVAARLAAPGSERLVTRVVWLVAVVALLAGVLSPTFVHPRIRPGSPDPDSIRFAQRTGV